MNILFLSELFYPHGGGAEYATYLYAKLLSQRNFNITVITNKFDGEPGISRHEKLTVYRLPLFSQSGSIKYAILKRFDILFSTFMRKMMKWADIVYVPRFWFSVIPLAKRFSKPVITHLHDYIPICPLSVLYDRTENKVCDGKGFFCSPKCIYIHEKSQNRNFNETLASIALNPSLGCFISRFIALSDAIICVSKQQRNIIANKETFLNKKIHVIYNPIPESSIIEMKGNDFGYFGGPNALKGFRVLLQALLNLKNRGSLKVKVHSTNFELVNEQLSNSLSRLGLSIYGKLDRKKFKGLYELIGAVVVPSIWPEPWPYVVVEALVYGRFVIASRTGGIPEQVEGCKGVIMFEAGNYNELAEAIEFVTGLIREEIFDYSFQNRETFLKRFDNDSTVKSFIRLCEWLI